MHRPLTWLGDSGQLFVMAKQLRQAYRKWLMAQTREVEEGVDQVVLELG